MEEHDPERRLGGRDYASYVPCSIPKAVYCNVVPAQRNFRNQLKSLSIHGLGKSKLLFSLSVVFLLMRHTLLVSKIFKVELLS